MFRDGSPLSDATSASPIALARGVVVRFLPQAVSHQVQVLVTEKLPATFMVLNLASCEIILPVSKIWCTLLGIVQLHSFVMLAFCARKAVKRRSAT